MKLQASLVGVLLTVIMFVVGAQHEGVFEGKLNEVNERVNKENVSSFYCFTVAFELTLIKCGSLFFSGIT